MRFPVYMHCSLIIAQFCVPAIINLFPGLLEFVGQKRRKIYRQIVHKPFNPPESSGVITTANHLGPISSISIDNADSTAYKSLKLLLFM
ncbi:uncharacterized protein PHALS_00963 [Plasmopara halstedii]|uniref:Uncharacterized protein n=1 Tax=Plasmopara halstedii TaxID=4781 RepID=A0A0P1ATK8_PLAHL|nr:uncharacterized protein PHALS_00963 [Plasmopara halstedii]CEG44617.1 hypothetical protein PHALS_00963 [Plasmopara halstedii]|eukprot:XP_024580986.1 hypothetical protein PHALS_00963 [Plasmopara halstedii]